MLNFNAKEDKFHKMFSDIAAIVRDGAVILRGSLNSLEDVDVAVNKIEELEHQADKLIIEVAKELHRAFITPIDREDIYSIMMNLENIVDSMNSAIHRFVMFNVSKATESSIELADMLVQAAEEIVLLMKELKLIGKTNKIKEKVISINKIEHNADHLFRKVVADLFRNETNPIEIIKWKDIYQIFENTIDNCEKLANKVEGVVMKNA